jgi:hypothetical protein
MSSVQKARDDSLNILAFHHQDGLVDLFIGWVAFLGGLGFLSGMPHFAGIAPAIFLPIWQSIRRKVTYPRLKHLEDTRTHTTFLTFTILMGLIGLAGLLIFARTLPTWLVAWMQQYDLVLFGLILAGIMGAVGAAVRVYRMFLYSGLIVALFYAGNMLRLDLGWILLTFGALMIIAGTMILIRFILTNPIRKHE